jgi:hypothetical protein
MICWKCGGGRWNGTIQCPACGRRRARRITFARPKASRGGFVELNHS